MSISPGVDLYIQVRKGFVGQNSSLNRWCKCNDVKRQHAEACLKGMWNGPRGKQLRTELLIASGIASSESVGDVSPMSGRDVA